VTVYNYSIFGLKVQSALVLPELGTAEFQGEPDVTICLGPVAAAAERGFGLHVADDAMVLVVPEIGRFAIRDGASITVDPLPESPDENVRLFLLGSAFGALLHQRGLLPLHANAVEFDGKAVAFMGPSGHGKSTLAAWFHDHGHRVIADDVCVIGFDDHGQPHASPGLPRLRLWRDALQATGRGPSDYARSYAGTQDLEKYDVPVAPDTFAGSDLGLIAVYLLDDGDEFAIDRLEGLAAAEVVFANTYRGGYVDAANGHFSHWAGCVRLVQTTPIYRLRRVRGFDRIDAECDRVTDHVRTGVMRSPHGLA
jgi:hypothetical protein